MRSVLRWVDLLWAITFTVLALITGISALQTEGLVQIVHGFSSALCALASVVSLDLYRGE